MAFVDKTILLRTDTVLLARQRVCSKTAVCTHVCCVLAAAMQVFLIYMNLPYSALIFTVSVVALQYTAKYGYT